MEATAKVIAWSGKSTQIKEKPPVAVTAATPAVAFAALEHSLIVLPDEQLNALGTIFCASPLRRAMTFEGYLVAKGFAREGE
ncbi:MAG: hypothetical protein ACREQQ_11465 [Candidatus Binatia bacterium]